MRRLPALVLVLVLMLMLVLMRVLLPLVRRLPALMALVPAGHR